MVEFQENIIDNFFCADHENLLISSNSNKLHNPLICEECRGNNENLKPFWRNFVLHLTSKITNGRDYKEKKSNSPKSFINLCQGQTPINNRSSRLDSQAVKMNKTKLKLRLGLLQKNKKKSINSVYCITSQLHLFSHVTRSRISNPLRFARFVLNINL